MTIVKQYVHHENSLVPKIVGSKGGKGGGGEPPASPV